MPTPKRGSAPHDSQPKVRKLDEDGEAPPSKIESATNSLKMETKLEKTAAAPRTKKKRPSVDEGNKPAKLSKQSSPPKDSSKAPPDPPVNKANLLNTTSASCGEAPSQRANSKVSLKRTASTESDDDEDLSSDGSKVDFFRERDDEDKARCVRKYSNKVKAKRRAEESSFDSQEMSEDLSSSPLDPVQIDHNYGRFSESASLQNTGDAEDIKDSAESFTEQERQEISHDATQKVPTDISISETGSTKTSVKIESANEEDKDGELRYPESQTLMDNKTPASYGEMADCVTPLGEENDKRDETESIKSQKDADNKTLASPEKTLCPVTGELHSSGEGAQLVGERTDSVCQSESQTHLSSQSVSEENELIIKGKTEEQDLPEAVGICAGKLDGVVLNEKNSAPDQVEISNPKGQPEENVRMTEFVTISDTQIDLSDQVASKEEFDIADIQAEMTDAVVSSCDDVNKTLEKSEDKFEESASVSIDFQSPQTSTCPDALVHLNHGVVTPDCCTDTLSECIVDHKENQTEMLSENVEDPEGQITTEVVLQSEENHLFSEKVTKVAAQSEGDSTSTGKDKDSSIQCSTGEIEEDAHTSHPHVTVKTQSPDDFESTTNFHEDRVEEIFKTMENKETVGTKRGSEAETPSAIETHTVVTPEICHSEPPGEMQKQGIQEVSESTTATSTEIHGDVTAEKCEHMETVECAVAAVGQDGIELHPVAAFKPSDIEAKVELQIQKSPVSEHNAVASSKSCHDAECDDSTAENLVDVDIQTADMLEEVCTQIETHSQTNQEVRERTICDTVQKVLEDANCAPRSQTEVDALAAASSEEVSNIAQTEEMQLQMISEPTTDMFDKAQKDLEMADCVSQSQTEVVEDVQASATSEKVSNIAPTEEMQTPVVSEPTTEICAVQEALENANCADQSQVEVVEDKQGIASSEKVLNISLIEEFQTPLVSEPTTDVPDEARTDLENAAFKSSEDVKCVSAEAQSQIEVYVDAAASEDVSNVAPTEEMQSQMVSEPTTDTTVQFLADHREESLKTVDDNEFKCESLTVTQSQMEVETTLTKESSNPARLLDVNKIQTEEDMQAPENTSSTTFVVETQTQKILDVSGQTTDDSNKELHENLLNVKNEDKVHFQCADELESEMQITPASVISAADPSKDMQRSQNEIDMQNVTTSEQDRNIPAVEMQNLKSPDVNENNTERQSVTNEESQNKMETSETLFSPPSAETQIQRSFNVTDSSIEVSEQVQESLRIPTNECLENENKAVEECVFAAGRTNKMETQAAAGLQENSQLTTTEQTQSQQGQAVSELTADTNISVSPPSAETEIQKRIYVTEPANDSSETIQESFQIPPNETNENENELTEECVDAAEMTNEMETQTAEMLDEVSQPTTTEQTQSQRGQEVSELTTDTGISASQLPPETQIQRSFDISDLEVEVSEIVQEIPSNENKAIEECVCTTDSSHKIEMQAAEGLQEISQPTTIELTQSQEVQEASELTTDISDSPPSSEIQIQKSLDTAERTDKIETEAAKMLLEVSQPTTTEERQNPRDQEVSELTTDTNVSVSPSSSETWIQKNFSVPDPASDISETVRESFSISSNEHCENENKVIEECADTAERTDEMETQPAEVLQEIPLPTVTEQIQKQKSQELSELIADTNLSVSPPSAETQVHEGLDVIEAAANISEAVQESFTSKECHENKEKATEECADTAERMNEMQMQTTETVEEIFQPATAEQTQNQRQQEVSELTTDADIFVSPPSAETEIQKRIYVTEPVNDSPEGFKIPPNEMNENENKAIEKYVDTAESTDEMETQTEVLQEISQPTITEQVQNQRNQEFCELTTDTEVENDSESEQSKNSVCVSEDHPKTDMHTSVTPEIYYQKSDVEPQNQINEVSEVHKNEDKDASECENVPETESNMETSAESEEMSYAAAAVELKNHLEEETSEHTANLSDEIQTPHSTANLGNKANDGQTEPEDVISGPKEGTDSALEEDIKVDASVSNAEGGGAESSEVIVFVCDQSDDTDVVIQAPEERIKTVNQSEVEFHENQVVYEPISSPESNSGGEVCTTIQLGETISFLELQSAETHHILGEESDFLTCDDKLEITHPKLENEEIVKEEICTSVVLMEVEATREAQCPAHARLERSNTTEDVKHIAAVSSSDISATDGRSQGATEKSERRGILECISAAEVTEQVGGDTEVNDATGITTTTTPAPTKVKTTDASSEDYVILEPVPVPESEIHFDIVTQAAAESGLSASLGQEEEISQKILSSSQQTVILEPGAQQVETTDEVKDTTVTIAGEVLEQETETNSLQDAPVPEHQPPSATVDIDMANAPHTNEDSNAAVMENVESTLHQEEVQILEDIEIGREVVLAEEDNEEDGDVVVIKPPDQPTEGSPKESEEKVNDNKKKQETSKTVKEKKSAEKREDEKKGQEVERPKKQEMNMQARTKARLAALAEQKAAAAKRSANRQQLNLLALCQEIAEDIATDSMLLKKIEEEKQAAAAAEAAKAEAIKKEHPAVNSQEPEPDNVVTPAAPEESSASVTPTPEPPTVQPSTADSAETKPAAEPPKRRFFISQISVPLKAHEKKKLTRYQRLRQVELQREKMSWARVKKLKSDQANQMFSDVDWQASFSGSFLMSSATPPPATSPSKPAPVSPATTAQPAQPKGDSPKTEAPTSELVKTGVEKTEPIKTEKSESELVKIETTKTEPTKTETSKTEPPKTETSKTEPAKTGAAKTEPVKAEVTKSDPPNTENRRITRQSKAQASQAAAVTPKPAPKVTRSSKRALPAVPPPMPNGLNAQKQKPVEYKPYRPRPKYSFDDFELDDDDSLLVSPKKMTLPTQLPRPGLQPSPSAQSRSSLKPTISSQPASQAKLKSQMAPPGQISGQSRPTAASQAHLQSATSKPTVTAAAQSKPAAAPSSKPVPSTSAQLKPPLLAASQLKPASAQPKPAASASAPLKTAGVNETKQFTPTAPQPASSATTEARPAAAKADDASVPQEAENPPAQENGKCKNTADPLSSLPASSLPSVASSDDTKKCEESPAETTSNASAENKTKTTKTAEKGLEKRNQEEAKPQDAATFLSDASLQKEVKKLKETDKDSTQTIIDAGQKHFGPVACSGCGMLYSAANPEDESQHLLFHNQFISAVKYVGWKKERILAEYPDGKIILVLPDDPKYALKKVEEIREMVDNDLGFQQVETKCPSQTKTFLFISIDKKVAGCLIAEHIQEGYRVIEEPLPEGSEGEKVLFERQKAWCCSTTPEPAICGISRIWVVSMMRRQSIATRMIECLRNNFIYGSYLRKDEIAFSDPTPDGKLFASHYFGTSQFLVYNFVSGPRSFQPKTQAV